MPSPQDILINALREINIIGLDQTAIPSEAVALCLSKFNRRVGQWNARGSMGQFEYSQVFTLPSAVNNFTMGTAADGAALVVTGGRAPVKIDSAKRLISGSTYEAEIPVLAFEEWNRFSKPDLATTLTLAVYLQTKPKLPVLYCYGFSAGEQLRLSWRNLLNAVAIADIATNIDFQDGMEDALTLTLAEDLARPFQCTVTPDLRDAARAARQSVITLNGMPPIAYPDVLESTTAGNTTLATFLSRNA